MTILNFPTSPAVGQVYTVGDRSWSWNGFAWQVVRIITPGQSAYRLAIANGFVGTEANWIASLKGVRGDTGPAGPTGPTGPAGDNGTPGTDGTNGTNGANGVGVPAGGGSGQRKLAALGLHNVALTATEIAAHYAQFQRYFNNGILPNYGL